METSRDYNARQLLIFAAAVVFLCMFIPFGQYLVYPFRLFGTFVHEAAHALAAVVSGGQVVGMHVNWDTSGLTTTRGGSRFLISSAGYLGSILLGALLLYLGRRRDWAKPTLIGLGVATLMATVFFGGYGLALLPILGFGLGVTLIWFGRKENSRNASGGKYVVGGVAAVLIAVAYLALSGGLLTWAIGLVVGGAVLSVGAFGSKLWAHITVLFLAVQTSLDGFHAVRNLLFITMDGRGHSDAANMAQQTGVPATFWALLWGLLGVAMVGASLWLFWRDEKKQSLAKAMTR
ncbi:MAG: M50 family metallopeptidase [Bradymonadaceae bacterium]